MNGWMWAGCGRVSCYLEGALPLQSVVFSLGLLSDCLACATQPHIGSGNTWEPLVLIRSARALVQKFDESEKKKKKKTEERGSSFAYCVSSI